MTGYFNKFVILKRINGQENCALKIEGDNQKAKICGEVFSPSFYKNNYLLFYAVSGEEVTFISITSPRFEISVNGDAEKGFSALLTNGELPLLYGGYGISLTQKDLILASEKRRLTPTFYDDEIIANENYFEVENGKEDFYSQTINRGSNGENASQKTTAESGTLLYENFNFNGENYYLSIKEKFDKIIGDFERDKDLTNLIPNGEFIKINYDKDRFYSVGRIFENFKVKYLCYAVLLNYQDAPSTLKNYCEFIPLSPFYPTGKGYYIIFQHADNGTLVKI